MTAEAKASSAFWPALSTFAFGTERGFCAAAPTSAVGPSRTSGEVRVESAKGRMADIASDLRPNGLMSTRPISSIFFGRLKRLGELQLRYEEG